MKQSAVEWLSNELYEKFEMRGDGLLYDEILNQAKEMEKQNIIDANRDGADMVLVNMTFITGEQYYNETFNGQNT